MFDMPKENFLQRRSNSNPKEEAKSIELSRKNLLAGEFERKEGFGIIRHCRVTFKTEKIYNFLI